MLWGDNVVVYSLMNCFLAIGMEYWSGHAEIIKDSISKNCDFKLNLT